MLVYLAEVVDGHMDHSNTYNSIHRTREGAIQKCILFMTVYARTLYNDDKYFTGDFLYDHQDFRKWVYENHGGHGESIEIDWPSIDIGSYLDDLKCESNEEKMKKIYDFLKEYCDSGDYMIEYSILEIILED